MSSDNSRSAGQVSRRQFFRSTAGAAAISPLSKAAGRHPPNVIILLTDDQGYGDLSCHGNPVLKTPALDKLHAESVRFTDFHSAPMCTPSRGQLLTGMDALHNRATAVSAGRSFIRRGIPILPEIFAAGGYATGLFGKWHVGDNYPYRPMDRGFQEAKYHYSWGLTSTPEADNDYFDGRYLDRGVSKRFSGYCTDFWFNEAKNWMRERASKKEPFLCYLPTNAPHGPLWVDPKYSAPYRRDKLPAAFFGMIANIDENVAKLERFLAETGLRDDTIFVYMTDNGGTAGSAFYNAGMRARKTQLYDGGHRVPCFVRWPAGKLRAPGDVNAPAQMQDLLPTLIDLCGLKKPGNAAFDGTSLGGLLRGTANSLPDRMLTVQYGQFPKKWNSEVIYGKCRLYMGAELYDIHADPGQSRNIADKNPDIVRKMREHYEKWWAEIEPTVGDFCPISIGSKAENPTRLSSADWQDVYCEDWEQVLEAKGGPRGAPWNIYVERDGEYQITLRRWPAVKDLPLNAACPEQQMRVDRMPAGKALPITGALLNIGGQELSTKTAPADKTAVFRVKLKAGARTRLQAWFQDAAGADLCGAYYAEVQRL